MQTPVLIIGISIALIGGGRLPAQERKNIDPTVADPRYLHQVPPVDGGPVLSADGQRLYFYSSR